MLASFALLPLILAGAAEPGDVAQRVDAVLERLARTERNAEAALDELDELGPAALPALRERAAAASETGERRAVLRALERLGAGVDLPLALAVAGREPELAPELERTACALLSGDATATRHLGTAFLAAPADLAAALARAAGASRSRAALDALTELLGRRPELDALLLIQVGQLARAAHVPPGERVCSQVRSYLKQPDEQLVRSAALTLGDLGDDGSVADLIHLLRDERPVIRETSLWALRRATDLPLSGDAGRWDAWLQEEERWHAQRAPQVYAQLRHRDPAQVIGALHELGRRRFRCREIALQVHPVLAHAAPDARRQACRTLGRLGARDSVPALLPLLADRDAAVTEAALEALRELTDVELEPDPIAARQALREAGYGDLLE